MKNKEKMELQENCDLFIQHFLEKWIAHIKVKTLRATSME